MGLASLKGAYLTFTARPGALRWLRDGEDKNKAQGLRFNCPNHLNDKEKSHGVCILFALETVPVKAAPAGRYNPEFVLIESGREFPPLSLLTIKEKIRCPYCDWQGFVTKGEVFWKPKTG